MNSVQFFMFLKLLAKDLVLQGLSCMLCIYFFLSQGNANGNFMIFPSLAVIFFALFIKTLGVDFLNSNGAEIGYRIIVLKKWVLLFFIQKIQQVLSPASCSHLHKVSFSLQKNLPAALCQSVPSTMQWCDWMRRRFRFRYRRPSEQPICM